MEYMWINLYYSICYIQLQPDKCDSVFRQTNNTLSCDICHVCHLQASRHQTILTFLCSDCCDDDDELFGTDG